MSVFPQQSCCSCLSYTVLCDGTGGCRSKPTGPFVSHQIENFLQLDLLSLHLWLCVFMKRCACMSVLKLLRSVSSQLYSTWSIQSVLWSHTNQAPLLLPPHSQFAVLFTSLYPFNFWSYFMPFTCSFSSTHPSPTSSIYPFSCFLAPLPPIHHSLRSLTPQLGSTMRWQWQRSGVCACFSAWCHTMSLYSSTLFL